jgi:hypothetical protein
MKKPVHPVLYWIPRGLVILEAIFISLFAFDVFNEGYDFLNLLQALAMHLLPTAVILVSLAIAWQWERVGGVLFIALGAYYIFSKGLSLDWSASLVIAGPLVLAGLLFLVNWKFTARQPSITTLHKEG